MVSLILLSFPYTLFIQAHQFLQAQSLYIISALLKKAMDVLSHFFKNVKTLPFACINPVSAQVFVYVQDVLKGFLCRAPDIFHICIYR